MLLVWYSGLLAGGWETATRLLAQSYLRIILNTLSVGGAGAYACFPGRRAVVQDNDAKLKVYLRHRAALVEYAMPIVGDRMRAEDVVQEAYLRFAPPSDTVSAMPAIERPAAYLYRIVRNLAIDLARRLSAEAWHPSSEALLSEVPADTADPEQEVMDRDQLQALVAALDELPERTRQAFDLHRFDERTFAEIGKILGLSQARAHGLVQEAIAHCMRRLARNERK
jgi:RNA polymerase sigma factor (sigma-70 family)